MDCDGGMLGFCENDNLVAERAAVVSRNPWTRILVIGQYNGQIAPEFQIKGRIKDVHIWHRVVP